MIFCYKFWNFSNVHNSDRISNATRLNLVYKNNARSRLFCSTAKRSIVILTSIVDMQFTSRWYCRAWRRQGWTSDHWNKWRKCSSKIASAYCRHISNDFRRGILSYFSKILLSKLYLPCSVNRQIINSGESHIDLLISDIFVITGKVLIPQGSFQNNTFVRK